MTTVAFPLATLLAHLEATAALPPDRAWSLPPGFYWREDVWALEVERVFRKDWMCVGRVDQAPAPGDWLKVDILDEPLVVIRDEVGQLRALSRVCRHRAMDLLGEQASQTGNSRALLCPYHLWSYSLDGRLKATPQMQGHGSFDRGACRLPEFPLEVWQGFIFVALEPGAPLAPRLAPLERRLAGFDLPGWRIAGTVPWGEVPVNWKVALENGAEFYHHIGTHRNTLQPLWPAHRVQIESGADDEWFLGRMPVGPDAAVGIDGGYPVHPTSLPPVEGLSARQRSETVVAGLFPMFFFALGPDGAIWFDWRPTGPSSHHLDIRIIVPPASFEAEGFADGLDAMQAGVHSVQAEDAAANVAVQRGLRARAAEPGPLAPLESILVQLQRYLARRLVPARARDPVKVMRA
jgi:phenylpropionate dioxygenase-like ring-hydroxylating dioxygenase large terminal subunit